jgi:branched-chain amino acid transport system permease protein
MDPGRWVMDLRNTISRGIGDKISWFAAALLSLLLILFPFWADIFWIRLVAEFAILALFAVAYNLILGQTGLFSFGHGGLFGLGAYLLAVPVIKGALSLPLAFVISVLGTALVSYGIGWFCLRLTGIYFSILTLAFSQLIWVAIWKFRGITGGDDGLIGLKVPALFVSPIHQYFFILALVALSIIMIRIITWSPFGFTLKAIRENSRRAAFTGINVRRYQLMAFTVSGFFTGLAGAVFAVFTRGAFVEFASVSKSFEPVFAAIVGGVNTFGGPVIGAGFMLALSHFVGRFTEYWPSVSGTILILVILFLPAGIVGTIPSPGRRRGRTRQNERSQG